MKKSNYRSELIAQIESLKNINKKLYFTQEELLINLNNVYCRATTLEYFLQNKKKYNLFSLFNNDLLLHAVKELQWVRKETTVSYIKDKKMEIKIIKLHDKAIIPIYANSGDAGMDLTATTINIFTNNDLQADYIEYGTGLSMEIPEGYVGLIFPRSSISKKDLILTNSVGVIDSGYRGEVKLRFKIDSDYDGIIGFEKDRVVFKIGDNFYYDNIYNIGDRIGQIIVMPYPKIEFKEVKELSNSKRSKGGFGSTGN